MPMPKQRRPSLTPAEQAELRKTGLVAGPDDRWVSPCGLVILESLLSFEQRRIRVSR